MLMHNVYHSYSVKIAMATFLSVQIGNCKFSPNSNRMHHTNNVSDGLN